MRTILLAASAVLMAAPAAAHEPQPAQAKPKQTILTEAGPVAVHVVTDQLESPWGFDFLPDGRMIVTEEDSAQLHFVTPGGEVSPAVAFPRAVFTEGQGGLLDVALAPDFARSGHVYISFAEPGADNSAGTALARARLEDDRLRDVEVIFRQQPKVEGPNHFGGRIVFDDDGHVFLAMGERFKKEPAQNISNTLGTVVRLNRDGSIPEDNPFVDQPGEEAIWTYGHRNIEAAAMMPGAGAVHVAEMGPMGGDEINRLEPGANYGWPLVSEGIFYNGEPIPDHGSRPDIEGAEYYWLPSISPSGMVFYEGEMFPEWRGSALVGGLNVHGLERVRIADKSWERIPLGARIRDVSVAADGSVYVLTNGEGEGLWRLSAMGRD
jgi:glucose/arabinose dehydrogenase